MTGINHQQDQLVAAYIGGTADPEAIARLEEAMLEDDDLFDRIQQEALLQHGLKTTLVNSDSNGASKKAFWRWPGLALIGALGLAVVALGGWIAQLHQQIDHLQAPQTGIGVITLHDQRSLLAERTEQTGLSIDGAVLIELDVSAHADEEFVLLLESPSGSRRWEGLRPDQRGYLTVLVHNLEAGSRLRLSSNSFNLERIHDL